MHIHKHIHVGIWTCISHAYIHTTCTHMHTWTTCTHTTCTCTMCTHNMHTFIHAGTLNMHITCTRSGNLHICIHTTYTHTIYTYNMHILIHAGLYTCIHTYHMHIHPIHIYYIHIQHAHSHTYKYNSIRAWIFLSDTYRPPSGDAKVRNHKEAPHHTGAFWNWAAGCPQKYSQSQKLASGRQLRILALPTALWGLVGVFRINQKHSPS